MPVANLSETLDKFAVRFKINVTFLLGAAGKGSIHFFLVNSGTATSTDIATGIDNIRVVRISN